MTEKGKALFVKSIEDLKELIVINPKHIFQNYNLSMISKKNKRTNIISRLEVSHASLEITS